MYSMSGKHVLGPTFRSSHGYYQWKWYISHHITNAYMSFVGAETIAEQLHGCKNHQPSAIFLALAVQRGRGELGSGIHRPFVGWSLKGGRFERGMHILRTQWIWAFNLFGLCSLAINWSWKSVRLSLHLSMNQSIDRSIQLSIYASIHLSSSHLPIHLWIHLSIFPSNHLSTYLSIFLSSSSNFRNVANACLKPRFDVAGWKIIKATSPSSHMKPTSHRVKPGRSWKARKSHKPPSRWLACGWSALRTRQGGKKTILPRCGPCVYPLNYPQVVRFALRTHTHTVYDSWKHQFLYLFISSSRNYLPR